MVADSLTNAVTVFELTAYGSLLLQAQQLTLDADYAAAEPLWQQVREYDYLNRLALRGLAKAAYSAENYEAAMDYAKAGNDSETYSLALEKTQSAFITQYFPLLFLGALVLVGGITSLILISVKRKLVLIPNAKVRTMVSGMYHPFRSFNDIKYKKMGSLPIAIVMTVLFYLTSVLAVTESDFRYTTFDAATYNSLFQIVQTVGLILLWSVAKLGCQHTATGQRPAEGSVRRHGVQHPAAYPVQSDFHPADPFDGLRQWYDDFRPAHAGADSHRYYAVRWPDDHSRFQLPAVPVYGFLSRCC